MSKCRRMFLRGYGEDSSSLFENAQDFTERRNGCPRTEHSNKLLWQAKHTGLLKYAVDY